MTDYDRWLEKPYTEQAEGEECEECGGSGYVNGEDKGIAFAEDCPRCDGTGYIDPPTPEEIKETKAEIDADRRLSE